MSRVTLREVLDSSNKTNSLMIKLNFIMVILVLIQLFALGYQIYSNSQQSYKIEKLLIESNLLSKDINTSVGNIALKVEHRLPFSWAFILLILIICIFFIILKSEKQK